MIRPRVDCPACGANVALYTPLTGGGWKIITHTTGPSSDAPECAGSRTAHSAPAPCRVTVELDARDAELVGMSLQLLARDHKSPDLTVAARLQRVGDALRRAAKIGATVEALEHREVVS